MILVADFVERNLTDIVTYKLPTVPKNVDEYN